MSFIFSYLYWHYSKAFLNIWGIFSNFLWATYRFFSIPLLLKTFFYPWHHLDDSYSKKLDVQDFFGTLITNTLMRLVGMFIRLIVICIGIICLFFVFIFEIIFFLIWIILPVTIVWFIYIGILKTL
ncbi:MAG: hypothetical protein NTX96_02355 [Candidatus Zambryskibacteria bacterium]|nr:hypothetical protein [Candidatus Zambryskibacteria bacterium]